VDLHISLDATQGLSRQIYEQIRQATLDGRLPGGTRMPSTRELAKSLGIARNTVATAFDHLVAEGHLCARPGVGTFVSDDADRNQRPQQLTDSSLTPVPLWRRTTPVVPPPMTPHAAFDFSSGIPDDSRFPYATWRRLVADGFRRTTNAALYGEPAGPVELRRAIAVHLGTTRGLQIGPEDIVVTSGVQQAASLIASVLVEPGDVVAVEEPGYPAVRRAFEVARARVVGTPVDEHGLVVDQLPHDAKLVYVTPAHQFPLGVRMSLPRRRALVGWARSRNAAIVEDDYDTDFRYGGRPVDPLHALEGGGSVLYVGSFSKSLLPALRVGYVVAPPAIRDALRRARFVADWQGTTPVQLALARFMENGGLAAHIRRMRREYERRRVLIGTLLGRSFARHLETLPNVAGLHLAAWARDATPDEVRGWVRAAAGEGVAVQAIGDFADTEVRPGLVLGFGGIPLERIEEGLRRLQRIVGP
jgi:GntR family transcriptional regulator/MocR family aminotransferase